MSNYYQKEIETASREEILAIQNEKIVRQVRYVYEHVPYYKKLMDDKGVRPEDIRGVDDIRLLPFLSKADLREAYPYGLLGTDLKNCVRIHSTSGTTGKRVVAFYTAPAPSSPPAAATRTSSRSATVTVCSPAEAACTAAPTRWAV